MSSSSVTGRGTCIDSLPAASSRQVHRRCQLGLDVNHHAALRPLATLRTLSMIVAAMLVDLLIFEIV